MIDQIETKVSVLGLLTSPFCTPCITCTLQIPEVWKLIFAGSRCQFQSRRKRKEAAHNWTGASVTCFQIIYSRPGPKPYSRPMSMQYCGCQVACSAPVSQIAPTASPSKTPVGIDWVRISIVLVGHPFPRLRSLTPLVLSCFVFHFNAVGRFDDAMRI